MEQIPSREVNIRSDSHKIPLLLWNPTVRYLLEDSPSLVPIVSQMNPVHKLTLYFFNSFKHSGNNH
jgi:hypothetical protein